MLTVIPDGLLHYLPFELLLSDTPEKTGYYSNYPFLLRKHALTINSSAAVRYGIIEKREITSQKNFATYLPDNFTDTPSGESLSTLKYAEREAEQAQVFFDSEIFAEGRATEENFKKTAGNFRFIHLPIHGVVNSGDSQNSGLFFQKSRGKEDGILYTREFYNLSLNTDLLMMTGCDTGNGNIEAGEGLMSAARAAICAGANSVLVSNWKVNDKSTSTILTEFFRNLKAGDAKDIALQKAKLTYLTEYPEQGQHPFFWSALTLIGNEEP